MNPADYVDLERGLVSRELFADRQLYELELKRIFARCYLYLGHESQIPNQHDYFTTSMGEDPVVVIRGGDSRVRAFHNSCRHRGMTVCRADSGNDRLLRCPYHGWTYDSSGKLVSVPQFNRGYAGELDRDKWGLIVVPKVESFCGLIFGSWDPGAPSLRNYLGDMAFYLELMVDRHPDGIETMAGAQKFVMPNNWKVAAENLVGDMYHVPVLHVSGVSMGFRQPMGNQGYAIRTANGHAVASEFGGALAGSAEHPAYAEYLREVKAEVARRHGEAANQIVPLGPSLLFPSCFLFDNQRYRSIWAMNPRGPEQTEVTAWVLLDRALPEEIKQATARQLSLAGGLFRADDEDCWREVQNGVRGVVGRRYPFNYQLGLHQEQPAAEGFPGSDFPGRMGSVFPDEGNQLNFYRQWSALMSTPSWIETEHS